MIVLKGLEFDAKRRITEALNDKQAVRASDSDFKWYTITRCRVHNRMAEAYSPNRGWFVIYNWELSAESNLN